MNVVLIVTLFLLFFLTLQGWRKGILGVVFGLISWVFIFLFVAVAHPYIENYMRNNTKIYDNVYQQTVHFLDNKSSAQPQDSGLSEWYASITEGIPQDVVDGVTQELSKMEVSAENNESLEQLLSGLMSDQSVTLDQLGGAANVMQISDGTQTVQQLIAVQLTDFMVQGIAVIVAFVIAQILVWIVGCFIKGVGKIPGIRQINGALGLVAGALEGFIVVWILMYIAACISTTTLGQGIIADINDNVFLTYLYNHNLIMAFISTI